MTTAARPVRPRRSERPVVAVTGAADGLGRALAARLAGCAEVRKVVAVDAERGDVPGVTWRLADVTDPEVAGRFAGVDVVVHLAVDQDLSSPADDRSMTNVRGTQAVLTGAAASGVRRVVLCTSAAVYGAREDNPVPLEEDAPLRALPDGALVADFLEIERLAETAPRSHPGLTVTVVRPAALVGPGVDSIVTRHFEAPRLLVVRGSHPRWQFCHVDDLVAALELVALGRVTGAVTAGCEGWLEQPEVEALTGQHRVELPARVALGTAERLHRIGVIPAAASDLSYLMHPWVVSSARLREAGWRPTYDNAEALRALLDEVSGHHALGTRRVGRRDAAVGAAGATVAVFGTAALVRRARKRRRRS
ncbi:MAG: NAD-dependent epimerase/dehydratase family protein [Actinomycetes bacterium]